MLDLYGKLEEFRSSGQDVVIVTVTEKEGMSPADVGKKLLVTEDGRSFGTIGGGAIEHYAIEKSKEIFKTRCSLSEKYSLNNKQEAQTSEAVSLPMTCGGNATLFYEFIGPKQYVYIFGAGHCGAALAKVLRPLGFYITIIDDRKDVIESLDDSANTKINCGFVEYIDKYGLKDNRFIVVCTPSHLHDFDVLNKIIELNIRPKYFGMLCSKKKIVDYLNQLNNIHNKNIDLKNFYSPIGLPTGGDSPEEIAISIASEMLSILYGNNEKISHMRDSIPAEFKYF